MANADYDYIIVGAGSTGCVLANRLSADPDTRVLLIEAGGPDRNFWLRLPVGYFRTIYDKRFSRIFDTEPSEGTAGRTVQWPRGRIVGGSSSINGLIFIRGQHGPDLSCGMSAGKYILRAHAAIKWFCPAQSGVRGRRNGPLFLCGWQSGQSASE